MGKMNLPAVLNRPPSPLVLLRLLLLLLSLGWVAHGAVHAGESAAADSSHPGVCVLCTALSAGTDLPAPAGVLASPETQVLQTPRPVSESHPLTTVADPARQPRAPPAPVL